MLKRVLKKYLSAFYRIDNNRYKNVNSAVVIIFYHNPTGSPFTLKAFESFYNSLKHLNTFLIEVETADAPNQLCDVGIVSNMRARVSSGEWKREPLINRAVDLLPIKYKYIFWLENNVRFDNNNWLVDSCKLLSDSCTIVQPFSYYVPLNRDEKMPSFDVKRESEKLLEVAELANIYDKAGKNDVTFDLKYDKMSHSFAYVYANYFLASFRDDGVSGKTGGAWGIRRDVIDRVNLYHKGDTDQLIARAACGQIPHASINKIFFDDIDNVDSWSKIFHGYTEGRLGYVDGTMLVEWDFYNKSKPLD
jgi:hypothetical protein